MIKPKGILVREVFIESPFDMIPKRSIKDLDRFQVSIKKRVSKFITLKTLSHIPYIERWINREMGKIDFLEAFFQGEQA